MYTLWYVLLWYTVNSVMFEWALLCPKLSGCLLQRHGGILVLMLRFAKRCPTWTCVDVDATVYDLAMILRH
jgi:hypothetical protein